MTGSVIDDDEHNVFLCKRYELQPIDPQTQRATTFFGLLYHTHIVKRGEVETFHDQVGYWLWEPAAGTVLQPPQNSTRPSAAGRRHAEPDARSSRCTRRRWDPDIRDRVDPNFLWTAASRAP